MEDKLPPLHPMYGKHHSEESKKKISDSMKGKRNNKGKHWKWKTNQIADEQNEASKAQEEQANDSNT